MSASHPIDWTEKEYLQFGLEPMVSKHAYHEMELFNKTELISLLNEYPRKWLQAFTMGDDPCRPEQWNCVDVADETDGPGLWNAVENGRLWLNLTHVEKVSKEFNSLITGMYEHLGVHCPHLKNPRANYSTLLISSPGAQVYYHLDAEPNMLWHMRGEKHLWVYPAMDTRLVPQNLLEDIYAGEIDENLPFDKNFDQFASKFTLLPGDVASWPHNGPHRLLNANMNVSLATSYYTSTVYKRQYVQLANRHILRAMGKKSRSMAETGMIPSFKRFSYRVINKIRPFPSGNRAASYITDLQVDPGSPNGLRQLPESKPASFARH